MTDSPAVPARSCPRTGGPRLFGFVIPPRQPVALLLACVLAACSLPDTDSAAATRPVDDTHGSAGTHSPSLRSRSNEDGSRTQKENARKAQAQADRSWVSARLQRVQDGDSLLVTLSDGQTEKLRIAGIDAPERTQAFAERARKQLIALTGQQPLRYRALKRDQYGRQVVILHSQQGKQSIDVGRVLLTEGLAWYFKRYERELPAELRAPYQKAEAEARRHRRGLWSEAKPLAPWDFRRQKRERSAAQGRSGG